MTESQTLILKNGNFYTGGEFISGNLVIRQGKIEELATSEEIFNKYTADKIINLEGKTVFPGFIDSHIHLVQTGFLQVHQDLSQASSVDELKELIRAEAKRKQPGEWIIGSSFDDNKFKDDRFPTKEDLDEVAPDNPVFIIRICTHLMIANSKALDLARIDKNKEAPQGGGIDRDESGEPNGILRRNAGDLVYNIIYSNNSMIKKAIKASLNYLKENGITTAHSMAIGVKKHQHYFNILQAYREAMEEEGYPVRVKLGAEHELLDHLISEDMNYLDGNEFLQQGYIKFFTDGSYGSRTALLNNPYEDEPDNCGIEATSKDRLYKYAKKAHEHGYQCAIHALGDKALSNALDVLESLIEKGHNPLRHRIVHAGLAPKDLIDRIKELNVSVDIQPNFVASEVDWLETALGNRTEDVYTWNTMKNEGINLAASSDCPVEPVNPFYGIRAATTRKNLENRPADGFNSKERVTLEDAIDMYTINGAYQYFDEDSLGSIEPNKFADLVVLSQNPMELAPDQLLDIKIDMTFVGGRLVYQR
ncbi:amidohydrolase [Natranaerobius thermophilus]|uniref:Amidohydrolase 3 n=1 Tax=Natranaerobius thermophilus (strain ATCC BAA-1301 / DSM 18059 / JW/NM-WN-LF) TaxID=457570 RepID=B2A284_NATTJ|nr:amidohydrolase family protein [Natranaerobius thermophilus]ACB86192.1 Amidohydrolase 3 [Natranaerobius thermophilus JW/NM-WN-LF]